MEWLPQKGGYRIGNLQPAHMDFRFFSLGNLWAIVGNLATTEQSHAILYLIEAKWSDLVAAMPLKICFPALEGREWQIITGSDPKNTPWSYHDGGSWPTLLWQLTVACIKMNRQEIAERAIKIAEKRIAKEQDSSGNKRDSFKHGLFAGYLAAKLLIANPAAANFLINVEDAELLDIVSCAFAANAGGQRRKPRKKSDKPFFV